jgi:hypothetical protein
MRHAGFGPGRHGRQGDQCIWRESGSRQRAVIRGSQLFAHLPLVYLLLDPGFTGTLNYENRPRGPVSVFNLPRKKASRKRGGDGWESNPPRTPQQRPADGFEDRGRHQSSFIPSLGNSYFGCQPDKQGCDRKRMSTPLRNTSPHVFEDCGGHQPSNIPS